jgi:proteasome lid subunit RPN8/RPN11
VELRVPAAVLDRIRAHARDTYPEECCGFLIGRHEGSDRVVTEARRAQNVSADSRGRRYEIDHELTRKTEAEFRVGALRIVGFYHSHPEYRATPSDDDRRAAWPYYVYAILSIEDGSPSEFTAWRLEEDTRSFAPVAVTAV